MLKESAGKEVIGAVRATHAGHIYLSERILDSMVENYLNRGDIFRADILLERLRLREREIMQLVVEGKPHAEIARILSISPKTVETHRSCLMRRLYVRNIGDLIKFSIRYGLPAMEEPGSISTNNIA